MADIRLYPRFDAIDRTLWQRLQRGNYPFLQYDYLLALEQSGAVAPSTGWVPQHIALQRSGETLAIIPCYLKYHSRGEYVFDWAWARGAEQLGIAYYPKLLAAIPFTPCPGPRWVGDPALSTTCVREALDAAAEQLGSSSWHLLFAGELPAVPLADTLLREDCQFHWHNRSFGGFEQFLSQLRSSKRKSIRRERRRLAEQGVTLERTPGEQVSSAQLELFYRYYCLTYAVRGQTPYLNLAFFRRLRDRLAQQLLLVSARQGDRPCAAALFLFDDRTLYGRWWGGDGTIDALHFEVCYYQGIEFAIERGLQRFDPGTQGEHKLIRGFEPYRTRSLHWVRDPRLQQPLTRWTAEERAQVARYHAAALQLLPFAASPLPR